MARATRYTRSVQLGAIYLGHPVYREGGGDFESRAGGGVVWKSAISADFLSRWPFIDRIYNARRLRIELRAKLEERARHKTYFARSCQWVNTYLF